MAKKINPKKRPATQADVKRAKDRAQTDALNLAMVIFLTVLVDKQGYDKAHIREVWNEVNSLSDSIAQGYVSFTDLRKVLAEEYDILI